MCVKRIKTKVNLELCLVGDYAFWQYFKLYDELLTWIIVEPKIIVLNKQYFYFRLLSFLTFHVSYYTITSYTPNNNDRNDSKLSLSIT